MSDADAAGPRANRFTKSLTATVLFCCLVLPSCFTSTLWASGVRKNDIAEPMPDRWSDWVVCGLLTPITVGLDVATSPVQAVHALASGD
jgi:hypothetical protein